MARIRRIRAQSQHRPVDCRQRPPHAAWTAPRCRSTSTACSRVRAAVSAGRLALAGGCARPRRMRSSPDRPWRSSSSCEGAGRAAAPAATAAARASAAMRRSQAATGSCLRWRGRIWRRNCPGSSAMCRRSACRRPRGAPSPGCAKLGRTAGENLAEYLQEESRDLVNRAGARGIPAGCRSSARDGRPRRSPPCAPRAAAERHALMRLRVAARLLQIQRALVRHGLDDFVRATHLYRPFRFLFYLSPVDLVSTQRRRHPGRTPAPRTRGARADLREIRPGALDAPRSAARRYRG